MRRVGQGEVNRGDRQRQGGGRRGTAAGKPESQQERDRQDHRGLDQAALRLGQGAGASNGPNIEVSFWASSQARIAPRRATETPARPASAPARPPTRRPATPDAGIARGEGVPPLAGQRREAEHGERQQLARDTGTGRTRASRWRGASKGRRRRRGESEMRNEAASDGSCGPIAFGPGTSAPARSGSRSSPKLPSRLSTATAADPAPPGNGRALRPEPPSAQRQHERQAAEIERGDPDVHVDSFGGKAPSQSLLPWNGVPKTFGQTSSTIRNGWRLNG